MVDMPVYTAIIGVYHSTSKLGCDMVVNGHRLQAGMHRVTMGCSAVRFLQIPFVVTPPRLPLLLSLALMPKSYESGQLLYQAGWKWPWNMLEYVGIC